jgi:protein kinase C substrate 80K-H
MNRHSLSLLLLSLLLSNAEQQHSKGVVLDFKCKDKTLRIKKEWVNDDYCDCPDGSDEPHTSACSHLLDIFPTEDIRDPTFTCPNHGHIPLIIPSSRVGDGICDCCDGSDERHEHDDAPKTMDCPNKCVELGLNIRRKRAAQQLKLRQGLRARNLVVHSLNDVLYTRVLELEQLKYDMSYVEPIVQMIEGRKLTEEAIEYKEQVWRAKFLFERAKESGEDVLKKMDGQSEKEKMDTMFDNSHAVLGEPPSAEEIQKLLDTEKEDNTTRIPRGKLAHRLQQLKDMMLLMSPPNLLSGITLTDIEEEIPEQRSTVRECPLSEFLEEMPAETVTAKEMIGAKATRAGWLSLLDISIAIGGVPPEVQVCFVFLFSFFLSGWSFFF